LRGVFKGISNDTTIQELLELADVSFINGKPQQMEAHYGYHSMGGWYGNYQQIARTMVDRNVRDVSGLAKFEGKAYKGGDYALSINEDNFFGINTDVVSGATTTIQNSYDTISGATVRISREHTSFQRALVAAGVMKEEDVIKGRF
jgi:hypothetical protein